MELTQSLVAQRYAAARTATTADPSGSGGALFGGLARDFAQTVIRGEQTAMAAMTSGSDPHALVQALAQTELAVETAVTLRNRVVEAYQEILRMPV
ncbi:MAG: flagellar hook-basal body complex protein FliE [Rubellimicrobium sp.]|nr:flagellar hook-basal body complex protein FliE [Rubellimicrobium sp.]